MTVEFEITTDIAASRATVFALSIDIDAHLASLADSGEQAIAGVTSGPIGLDETVTWRARHLGRTWTMTSRISALEPPDRFVDEQVKGPFARFRHEHRFVDHPITGRDAAAGAAGTRMTDHIRFTAPLGPLGRIAELAVLERYLPKLIRQRNAYLTQAAEDADAPPPDAP